MADNPRTTAALTVEDLTAEGKSWIEVMPTGDKIENGRWKFTITPDDLETYAQSIRDKPGLIPVDYDHAGAEGGSSRAAGWFTGEAEVRDVDGSPRLVAEIDWTPQAEKEIRDGEFRRISPEFSFHEKDPKTGLLSKAKELIAATLTNRPFFTDLSPVTARDLLEDDDLVALTEQYEDGVADLVLAALGGDIDRIRDIVKHHDKTEGDEMPTDYLKALGLDENSDDAQKIAAALTQKDEQILALQAEVTDLKAEGAKAEQLNDRIAELEARDRKRDVDVLLAKGVDSGRILPSEKETLAGLFADNVNGLKTLLASRPAGFYDSVYGRTEKGSGGRGISIDDPDTLALAREMGVKNEPLDEQSAQLHLRAMAVLREQGKDRDYTADMYRAALDEAMRTVSI